MSQPPIFYFSNINKSVVGETYQEGNQKYSVAILPVSNIPCPNGAYSHLVVPDDNSTVTNIVRTNSTSDCFTTPLSNLKFCPNLFKEKGFSGSNVGWIIKGASQVEKYSPTEPPLTEITFKVISQKKVIGKEFAEGCYYHELEIEPLSLGIKGMPEISTIAFEFTPPGGIPTDKSLNETWLYNHKILTESAGKTFTLFCFGIDYFFIL